MQSITNKTCAVLFIDLLGIGTLTTGKIKISDECYKSWEVHKDQSPQMLAAKILVQFRKNLSDLISSFSNIHVAQLSDGAFIWSSDINELLLACHKLMKLNIESGIFCRGGMSYGDVITTTDETIPFGQFILGDAVTRAVRLESIGKGSRIFLDEYLYSEITLLYPNVFKLNTNEIMTEIVNYFNGDFCYEFRWYATHDLNTNLKYENVNKYYHEFHNNLCKMITFNLTLNRFIWNFETSHYNYTIKLMNSLADEYFIHMSIDYPLPVSIIE